MKAVDWRAVAGTFVSCFVTVAVVGPLGLLALGVALDGGSFDGLTDALPSTVGAFAVAGAVLGLAAAGGRLASELMRS